MRGGIACAVVEEIRGVIGAGRIVVQQLSLGPGIGLAVAGIVAVADVIVAVVVIVIVAVALLPELGPAVAVESLPFVAVAAFVVGEALWWARIFVEAVEKTVE